MEEEREQAKGAPIAKHISLCLGFSRFSFVLFLLDVSRSRCFVSLMVYMHICFFSGSIGVQVVCVRHCAFKKVFAIGRRLART